MRKSLRILQEQLLHELGLAEDTANPVTNKAFIFTTAGCPYCTRALKILSLNDIYTIEMDVDEHEDLFYSRDFFPDGEFKPRIWITSNPQAGDRPTNVRDTNWLYIGGCDDLVKYCQQNSLKIS